MTQEPVSGLSINMVWTSHNRRRFPSLYFLISCRQLYQNVIMRTSEVGTTPMMETDGAMIGNYSEKSDSTLKMESEGSSETSVTNSQSTRHHNPEDCNLSCNEELQALAKSYFVQDIRQYHGDRTKLCFSYQPDLSNQHKAPCTLSFKLRDFTV